MVHKTQLTSLVSTSGYGDLLSLTDYQVIVDKGFKLFIRGNLSNAKPSLAFIQLAVQIYFNAPTDYLSTKSRLTDVKNPRFWFIYFARKWYTCAVVALRVRRNHATVLHAEKRVGNWITTYKEDKDTHDELLSTISRRDKAVELPCYTIT